MSIRQPTRRKPVPLRKPACPWLAAAERTGDARVLVIVSHVHPASRCPARRERAT